MPLYRVRRDKTMCSPYNVIVQQDCLHLMRGNFLQIIIFHPSEDHLLPVNHESEVHSLETLHVLIKRLHPLYAQNYFHVSEVHYEKVLRHRVICHRDAQLRNKVRAGQESPPGNLDLKAYMCFRWKISSLYQGGVYEIQSSSAIQHHHVLLSLKGTPHTKNCAPRTVGQGNGSSELHQCGNPLCAV